MQQEEATNILLTIAFGDQELQELADVSPRLKFAHHPTDDIAEIDLDLLAETEIFYAGCVLPDPEDVPQLKWVQFHTTQMHTFLNHPLLAEQDIVFTNTSGIQATTIAEYVMTMFLMFGQRLPAMITMKSNATWPREDAICSRIPPQELQGTNLEPFIPRELRGATVGIVGYGSVGREVARLAAAFGMTVLATKRDVRHPAEDNAYVQNGVGDPDAEIVDRLYPAEALHSMLRDCDFIAVTVPLVKATHHLINADALAAMKPAATLVNVSRGEVIDEAALAETMQEGHLAGAALDSFEQEPLPADSPLWALPNVILSPHTAGFSHHYNTHAARLFASNLSRYLEGKPLLNQVDRTLGY